MKTKFLLLILVLFIFNLGWSQNDSIAINNKRIQEEKAVTWLEDLHTSNVIDEGDRLIYNEETKLLLSDPAYYNVIYPEKYNWVHTRELLKKKAVKQALWTMINLYGLDKPESRTQIVNTLITLDQLIDMEKVLVSSYYSYISFDPEVVIIEDGIVKEFTRPDIAEEKLNYVKELTVYILKNREQKAKENKK
jgi:hypothetical protein